MCTCSCSMHCLLPFTMFCKCCWCIFKAVALPRVRNSLLKILLLRAIFIIHRKRMQFNSLTLLNKGQASEVHQMSKCVWVSGFCWGQMKDRGKQIRKTTKCQYISKLCVSSDSGTWMDIPYVLYISRIISLFVALSLQELHSHGLSNQTFLRFAGILVQAAEPLLCPFIQGIPLHHLYLQLNVLSNNHWEHFQDPCTFTWTGTQYWKDVLLAGLCFLPWLHFPVWIYTAALQWGKLLWAGGTGGFDKACWNAPMLLMSETERRTAAGCPLCPELLVSVQFMACRPVQTNPANRHPCCTPQAESIMDSAKVGAVLSCQPPKESSCTETELWWWSEGRLLC